MFPITEQSQDLERLVDLAWESIDELPFDVHQAVATRTGVFFRLEHVTDGCHWFRLPAVAAQLSDVTVLRLMEKQLERILDVLWERTRQA